MAGIKRAPATATIINNTTTNSTMNQRLITTVDGERREGTGTEIEIETGVTRVDPTIVINHPVKVRY